MTERHEEHLRSLLKLGAKLLDEKYRRGQDEHGGYLPDKPGLLNEALDEALDQFVYIATAREQFNNLLRDRDRMRTERAVMIQKLTQACASRDWALVAEATMGAVDHNNTVHF